MAGYGRAGVTVIGRRVLGDRGCGVAAGLVLHPVDVAGPLSWRSMADTILTKIAGLDELAPSTQNRSPSAPV